MAKVYIKEMQLRSTYDFSIELTTTIVLDQRINKNLLNDTEILEALLSKAFFGDNDNYNKTPREEKYLDIITKQSDKIKALESTLKQLPKEIKEKMI